MYILIYTYMLLTSYCRCCKRNGLWVWLSFIVLAYIGRAGRLKAIISIVVIIAVQHFQNFDSKDLGLWDLALKNDRSFGLLEDNIICHTIIVL